MTAPHLDVWVTSTGRPCVLDCVREFVRYCDYPNWRMLIFESEPNNPHNTVDVFKSLDCEKMVWTGDYPPLGWVLNLLMDNTERFFVRVDDDCWPVCPTKDMMADAIKVLDCQPIRNHVVSHVALEMNPRLGFNAVTNQPIPNEPGMVGVIPASNWGPFLVLSMPGSMPVVDKRFILPWNETCHWRQVELYHINFCIRQGFLTIYLLKWWGVMGHFSAEGVDGTSREKNLRQYREYQRRGFFGLRRPATWGTSFTDAYLRARPQ